MFSWVFRSYVSTMSRRITTILDQCRPDGKETRAHVHLMHHLYLQSLQAQMHLSPDRLKEMALYLLHEMHTGLEQDGKSTLKMLPSYVYRRDPAQCNGPVYALDLGGSNFRVLRMVLKNGQILETKTHKDSIPAEIIKSGTSEQLFDFIALNIDKAITAFKADADKAQPLRLGFTFSFPVKQHSINSGSLVHWTKEFNVSGVVGNDVVPMLRAALVRRKIAFSVSALCNDTVGTLITRFLNDDTAISGVILGTGSNACYWERNAAILKCPEAQQKERRHGEMVINMELGNFDSKSLLVLPVTQYDQELDAESEPAGRGQQRLEKMISGKYLGEIARRILVDFAKKGVLPAEVATGKLAKHFAFESQFVGACVSDLHSGLPQTERIFASLGSRLDSEGHRRVARTICRLVSNRAAQLSGMFVAATLIKRGAQADATVAVDGSVFEKQPYFRQMMEQAIKDIVGPNGARLVLTRDGSGLGAGAIAALQ